MTDKEIIEKIAKKDEEAFRLLVEKHKDMVVNVCYGFLHKREDALDVSQEVFIQVFRSAERFRHEAKLSTWLYRIAANRSLNFLRSKKRNAILNSLDVLFESNDSPPETRLEAPERSAQEALEQREEIKVLRKALATLPKKQRMALTLHKYQELSYQEIAEIMEVSVSNVGVLIKRGKEKLQKKMLKFYEKN